MKDDDRDKLAVVMVFFVAFAMGYLVGLQQ
jgi:hypothetical protein